MAKKLSHIGFDSTVNFINKNSSALHKPFNDTQTLGMMVVGTFIVNASDMKSKIAFGTAVRRQIARIGMVWGVAGWLFLLFGKQYVSDYAIVDKKYSSINIDEEGWVKVHNENQYKVIFFVLFLAFVFSYLQGVIG